MHIAYTLYYKSNLKVDVFYNFKICTVSPKYCTCSFSELKSGNQFVWEFSREIYRSVSLIEHPNLFTVIDFYAFLGIQSADGRVSWEPVNWAPSALRASSLSWRRPAVVKCRFNLTATCADGGLSWEHTHTRTHWGGADMTVNWLSQWGGEEPCRRQRYFFHWTPHFVVYSYYYFVHLLQILKFIIL